MTDLAAIPGASELFDLDPAHVACPYPTFSAMREVAPVAWHDTLEAFAVTSYDLILDVLRQPERFSSRSATGPAGDRRMMQMMLEVLGSDPELAEVAGQLLTSGNTTVLLQADPPDHPRQRALVNRAFTPGAIRRLHDQIVAATDELIEHFVGRGHVELISEFAIPLPMTMISTAVGVSLDRMDDFMHWSRVLVNVIGKGEVAREEVPDLIHTRVAMAEYLGSVVAERAAEPRDDLISKLVQAEIDGERLTSDEVVSMVVQFLLAGNHTTAMLIAGSMLRLSQDPELADRLRGDSELIGPFLEEVLRTTPPINGTYRIALEDYELGGVTIPAGSALWLVYASANRDPEHFVDPDDFQCPNSTKSPHLAFGFGAHYCLGANLARAEASVAVGRLLDRCHEIRLAVDPAAVQFERSFMLHGMQSLPMTFTPA
jgi:cytochrome P450